MALTRPILRQKVAFDATSSAVFTFQSIGGDQVVANRLVIKNNATGAVVYDQTQQSLAATHTVAANSLVNGTYYVAQIQTFNSSNVGSDLSAEMQFWCYTTPTIEITNIPEDNIISNASYNFQATYNQAEGELGKGYDFFLYNSEGDLIKAITGDERIYIYDTVPPPTYLNYTFTGLQNNTSYKIKIVFYTINDTEIQTPLYEFQVKYKSQAISSGLVLTNNCAEGNIKIESLIHSIEGTSTSNVTYIDNATGKEADLTDGNVVSWENQFNFFENYVTYITGRNFQDNTTICTMGNQNKMIWRIYLDENNNNAEMACVEFINEFVPGYVYRIFSNSIPKPAVTDYIVIYHKMGNDLADITIENIGSGGA